MKTTKILSLFALTGWGTFGFPLSKLNQQRDTNGNTASGFTQVGAIQTLPDGTAVTADVIYINSGTAIQIVPGGETTVTIVAPVISTTEPTASITSPLSHPHNSNNIDDLRYHYPPSLTVDYFSPSASYHGSNVESH